MFLLYQIFKITKPFSFNYAIFCSQRDCVLFTAKKLKINLIFVPVGATNDYQPLDVLVNGAIKSIGKMTKEKYIRNSKAEFSVKDSITSLIEAVKTIKVKTIIDSFYRASGII